MSTACSDRVEYVRLTASMLARFGKKSRGVSRWQTTAHRKSTGVG